MAAVLLTLLHTAVGLPVTFNWCRVCRIVKLSGRALRVVCRVCAVFTASV